MSNWVKGEDPMQLTNKSTDRNAYNDLQLRFVELVEQHKKLEQENEKLKEQVDIAERGGACVVKYKPILAIWAEYLSQFTAEELVELKKQNFVISSDIPNEIKTI